MQKEERIGAAMSDQTKRTMFWKFLAVSLLFFALAIFLWAMFDVHVLRPDAKEGQEALDVAIWVLPPTLAVALVARVGWQKALRQVHSTTPEVLEGSDLKSRETLNN